MSISLDNKKITIAAGIFPPDIGGPATYVVKLGTALAEKGWNVLVVCYSDVGCRMSDVRFNFSVFRVLRQGSKLMRYFRYFWRVMRVARDSDVIYAQGPISAGLPALLTAKLLRKRFIVKVVGDPAWEQVVSQGLTNDMIDEFQKKIYKGRIKRLKKIRSFVCQRADMVITPSEYLKKIVVGWGVDGRRVVVVYNSVEKLETTLRHGSGQGSEKLDMNDDVILSVGRLVKWKGFRTLIELMPELLEENPKFKLIILGGGPEKKNYQLSIINYQLQDKVELVGTVSHEEVMRNLEKAKVFVLNTGYEGLPHSVLEAMNVGCPVVTTRVGGNPEVVRDGENGLLVEYNNREQLKEAILKIWRDDGLRRRLVESARKGLDKFSFEEMINKTERVLIGLINS